MGSEILKLKQMIGQKRKGGDENGKALTRDREQRCCERIRE
jgi:hypothetical protein